MCLCGGKFVFIRCAIGQVGSQVKGETGRDTTVVGGTFLRVPLQRRAIRSLRSGMFSMYTDSVSISSRIFIFSPNVFQSISNMQGSYSMYDSFPSLNHFLSNELFCYRRVVGTRAFVARRGFSRCVERG